MNNLCFTWKDLFSQTFSQKAIVSNKTENLGSIYILYIIKHEYFISLKVT